jgi:hypothetical protein
MKKKQYSQLMITFPFVAMATTMQVRIQRHPQQRHDARVCDQKPQGEKHARGLVPVPVPV